MKIHNYFKAVFVVALILAIAGTALARVNEVFPASQSNALNQVQLISFSALNNAELAAEDVVREEAGLPYRFAVSQDVHITPDNSGTWETLNNGRLLWRHRFTCPEVISLNLGFSKYQLPQDASLLIYAADGSGAVHSYSALENGPGQQLWTPVLPTDELVIELEILPADRRNFTLELTHVNCGYRGFGELFSDKSGSCNIDVVCSEGDGWRNDIASIGMYSLHGTDACTGVMVNNTENDKRPLFLTANHCFDTQIDATSIIIYWNFQSPACGDQGGGSLLEFSSGSTLLATSSTSDFTLVELDENPDADYGVTYAGWDRSATVPSSAVALHHPSTDEKSISFEDDPLSITSYLQNPVPGNSTHLRVTDWDQGTTEPGSSGSPLFNSDHRIVGQLHGGYASCTSQTSDWYGRLFTSWQGDGTADSRLQDYLDPSGSGALVLDLVGGIDPDPEPPENFDIYFASATPNPFLGQVDLVYNLNDAAVVRARVFNIKGYLIRDFGELSGHRGENSFVWDGLDGQGRATPAGLYLFYLESGDQTARGQVIRLR